MKIGKDCAVTLRYSLKDEQGSEIENNQEGVPLAYLHGHKNLLPALENALEGAEEGQELSVTLPPEDAYGERKANAVQRVPIKHLMGKVKKARVGSIVRVNTENGQVNGTVVKAGKFVVDVDMNHPFAGKTLTFDLRIEKVRDASQEELDHGHVHGEGGHHH